MGKYEENIKTIQSSETKKKLEAQKAKIKVLTTIQESYEKELEESIKKTKSWYKKMNVSTILWGIMLIPSIAISYQLLSSIILDGELLKFISLTDVFPSIITLLADVALGTISIISYSTYRIFKGDKEDKELHKKQNEESIRKELLKLKELTKEHKKETQKENLEKKSIEEYVPTNIFPYEELNENLSSKKSRVRILEN